MVMTTLRGKAASLALPALIALLGLALLAPAAVAAPERTVSVSASATVKVPNDTASLGFSVSKERRSRGAALRAVSAQLREVIAAVQGIPGVGAGDVTTGRISVRKTSRGQKVVYRAAEGIGVTLHQPDGAGDLVAAAIAAGATGVSGPNFFVGDPERSFASALAAAFESARQKASILAASAGASLGPAVSIEESGGSPPVRFDSKSAPAGACGADEPVTAVSKRCGAAAPPVKPGTSTVTATVSVVFALQ
jgi:uncharacterized protein YggE